MSVDFEEYTECKSCQHALMYCIVIVPQCGKREECECEIMPLTVGL